MQREGKAERRADRKLAKQLQRASQNTDATGDPYEAVVEAKQPRTKLDKSGKDIAARQARIASRRQADARLQRHMQQLQGSVVRPAPQKVPPATTQFSIGSPPQGKKRPLLPIQDIARAFARASRAKRGRFDTALNRGNMLADLLADIP